MYKPARNRLQMRYTTQHHHTTLRRTTPHTTRAHTRPNSRGTDADPRDLLGTGRVRSKEGCLEQGHKFRCSRGRGRSASHCRRKARHVLWVVFTCTFIHTHTARTSTPTIITLTIPLTLILTLTPPPYTRTHAPQARVVPRRGGQGECFNAPTVPQGTQAGGRLVAGTSKTHQRGDMQGGSSNPNPNPKWSCYR
jgi:hypothetical protein